MQCGRDLGAKEALLRGGVLLECEVGEREERRDVSSCVGALTKEWESGVDRKRDDLGSEERRPSSCAESMQQGRTEKMAPTWIQLWRNSCDGRGFPRISLQYTCLSVRDREKLSHNKGSPQMTSKALTWYERIRREKRVLSEGKV